MVRYDQLKEYAQSHLTEWTWEVSADSYDVCSLQGRRLYSRRLLSEELRRFTQGLPDVSREGVLIVLGSAIGYHVEALEHLGYRHIVVIERSLPLARLFEQVFDRKHITYIGPKQDIRDLDAVFARFLPWDVAYVQVLPVPSLCFFGDYQEVEARVQRLTQVYQSDLATRLRFEDLWCVHVIRSIGGWTRASSVAQWIRSFQKEPAMPMVLCSAGPSLPSAFGWMEKWRDRICLMAVDTALRPLVEAGLCPDVVFALDAQVHNVADFMGLPRTSFEKTLLVADDVTHPKVRALFQRVVLSRTAHVEVLLNGQTTLKEHALHAWFRHLGIDLGFIETGGSVATSLFHLGYLLGGDPIILVGQDLAYTAHQGHAPSTIHAYQALAQSHRFRPVESAVPLRLSTASGIQCISSGDGQQVEADTMLVQYRQWFEESARTMQGSRRLWNATAHGARIDGFETQSEAEIQRFLSESPCVTLAWDTAPFILEDSLEGAERRDQVVQALKEAIDQMPVDSSLASLLLEAPWSMFRAMFLKELARFEQGAAWDSVSVTGKRRRLQRAVQRLYYPSSIRSRRKK